MLTDWPRLSRYGHMIFLLGFRDCSQMRIVPLDWDAFDRPIDKIQAPHRDPGKCPKDPISLFIYTSQMSNSDDSMTGPRGTND